MLRAIRNVNQLITHERDEKQLLQKSCDYLTERQGFFNAWIVFMDDQTRVTDIVGSRITGILPSVKEKILGEEYPKCIREALKTGHLSITENPAQECEGCLFTHSYHNRGGMSLRIQYEDRIYGVLTVSVEKQFLQDNDEHELLRELAGDIGFALHNIEVTRGRMELRESLKHSSVIVENSPLNGNAVAYQGVVFDITEQINNESELRFQSMLLNQIQEHSWSMTTMTSL